jgi:hypothetical protein
MSKAARPDHHRTEAHIQRAQFMGGAALGAAAAGAMALGAPMLADSASHGEIGGLTAMLNAERVLVTFHLRALESGRAGAGLAEYLQRVVAHDEQHRDELIGALGDHVGGEPAIAFEDALFESDVAVATTSAALKDVAIAVYNGQAGNMSRQVIALTSRLAAVDARHAAWVRSLAGVEPVAVGATDPGISAETARRRFARLGVTIGGTG